MKIKDLDDLRSNYLLGMMKNTRVELNEIFLILLQQPLDPNLNLTLRIKDLIEELKQFEE